jgi:hypothetical protein
MLRPNVVGLSPQLKASDAEFRQRPPRREAYCAYGVAASSPFREHPVADLSGARLTRFDEHLTDEGAVHIANSKSRGVALAPTTLFASDKFDRR